MRENHLNFNFIREGILAGGRQPSRFDLDTDFEFFWSQRIRAILTLQENPLPRYDWPGGTFTACHVPIQDFSPPTLDQADEAIAFLRERIAAKEPVLVHCGAGIGRTGTILAAYLIAIEALAAAKAINEIRHLRPGSIETLEQEDFLKHYEEIQKVRREL